MSGFPAIRPGMKINPLGKTGLPSRYKGNVVLAATNALLNTKIVRGTSDAFHITPNNMVLELKDDSASSAVIGVMHPFKIYPTGAIDVDGISQGFNVRAGVVDVRYLFHTNDSVRVLLSPGVSASRVFPENIDDDGIPPNYTPNPIPSDNTFFLDPTPETSTGINYGAYYSFWIEITPDTDNGGAYDGTVEIQSRRFTIGSFISPYPSSPYPSIASVPDITSHEIIPIGIVQVTAATDPFFNVPSGTPLNGSVWQERTTNATDRFSTLGNSGPATFWGEWGTDPGVNSGNRIWYPGDWIVFVGGGNGDPLAGYYMWGGPAGSIGGTPTGPLDGTSLFKELRLFSADHP